MTEGRFFQIYKIDLNQQVMNIVKENTDALNAVIKLNVIKEDYEKKVEDKLKDYRRKANIPGFRPGKVPAGMIKKMYYKPVLAEELNKIVSESLFKYIYDEKLEILGEPLPTEKEDEKPIDFDNDTEFDFSFDIGLSPEIELKISTKDKIPYYKIKVDKDAIEKSMDNIAQRYGSFKTIDTVNEKSVLKGEIKQLDENGAPMENGHKNEESSISVAVIKDDSIKKEFLGKKKDDILKFDLKKAFPNDTEIAAILRIDKDKATDITGEFEFAIQEVTEYEKAEVNKELFDKAYGEGTVTTEEEFRNKISEELKNIYKADSDYKFNMDAIDHFIKKHKLELPIEFLKRWMLKSNEDKFTAEELEKDFPKFEKDLKWQLIRNKITKENNIEVNEEEALAQSKKLVLNQYRQYGISDLPDDILTNSANQVLQNEQEKRRVYEMVSDQKVFQYLKESVKLDEKEITLEKLGKLFEESKK